MTGYTETELLNIACKLAAKYGRGNTIDGLLYAQAFLNHNDYAAFGVEYVSVPEQCNGEPEFSLAYLNTGDTYCPTIGHCDHAGFIVTSWGEWYEQAEQHYCEDTNTVRCHYCGEYAERIEGVDWGNTVCSCGHFVSGGEAPTCLIELASLQYPEFDDMWQGYTQALGFTAHIDSEDGQGESLFEGAGDFDQNWQVWSEIEGSLDSQDIKTMVEDLTGFIVSARSVLPDFDNWEQVGIDFHYTRNGHGTGFWDRPEVYGEACQSLSDLCKPYGSLELTGTRDENGEFDSLYITG